MQTLLMSNELKLDEVYCLLCLLTSHEEVSKSFPFEASSQSPLLNYLEDIAAALEAMAVNVYFCLQRGDVTAEAGAGIYFTERRALVEALHHLLQLQALPDAEAFQDIQIVVKTFVEALLAQTSGGQSTIIARLVELIGVSASTLASSPFIRCMDSNIVRS